MQFWGVKKYYGDVIHWSKKVYWGKQMPLANDLYFVPFSRIKLPISVHCVFVSLDAVPSNISTKYFYLAFFSKTSNFN